MHDPYHGLFIELYPDIFIVAFGDVMIFGKYAAAAGAVMLVVLWPFASGQIAQKLIEQQLDIFASPDLHIGNRYYERGYLTSEIETEFTTLSSSSDVNKPRIIVKTQLNHGFLGVSGHSEIVMTEDTKDVVKQFWSQTTVSPVTVKFDADVLGSLDFTASVLPIDSKLTQLKLKTSDAVISGKIESDRRLDIRLDLVAAEVFGDNGAEVSVKRLIGKIAGKMQDNLWIGEQSVKIEKAQLTNQNINLLFNSLVAKNVNSLEREGKENIVPQRFHTTNFLTSSEVMLNNFYFKDFAVGVNLKNVNHLALNNVFASINEEEYNASKPANVLLIDEVDELIALGAEASIQPFQLTTDQGTISGKVQVDIEPDLGNLVNELGLIDQVSGNIDVVVPNALIEKIPLVAHYLPELMNKGFVVKEEENTHFKGVIVGDKLVSPEGSLFPLAWLLFMI